MTIAKQLFSLQELDQALDSVRTQKAGAERELTARLALERIEQSLVEEKEKLEEIQNTHRTQQLDTESLKERSAMLEGQLYGGELTNPRDLASLEMESGNVKAQVDQKDLQLLELSVRAEDTRNKIGSLEQQLTDTQEAWDNRHAQLTEQLATLITEEEGLTGQRDKLAATLDQSEVHRYDSLRRSKGGTAVAKVERGLCQACRMSLPSQHLQRVRSGRYEVMCSSCGRMLFLG